MAGRNETCRFRGGHGSGAMHDQIKGSGAAEFLTKSTHAGAYTSSFWTASVALRLSQTSGDPDETGFILTGIGGLGLQS